MNKTLWYSTIMLLSVGILLAIFAPLPHLGQALFSFWNNPHITPHTDNTNPEPLVYRNEEFGFQMTLPQWWEIYKAFIYRHDKDRAEQRGHESFAVEITLPTWEEPILYRPLPYEGYKPENYAPHYSSLIIIQVWSPKIYHTRLNQCKQYFGPECAGAPYEYITLWHNDRYYFTISGVWDMTRDHLMLYGDQKYIDTIEQSFQAF